MIGASEIFQKHKDVINEYLNAHGHDTARAFKEWEAKQDVAKKIANDSVPNAANPAK